MADFSGSLKGAVLPLSGSEVVEIGGSDQVAYVDIMKEFAYQRGMRRLIVPMPVLSPKLSSLWLGLVTPLYARVGRKLIDSVRHDTIVRSSRAKTLFSIRPMGMRRDYRGGGRQSARETASRVAAGGIAKQILKFILGKKYDVVGGVTQLGILGSNPKNWNEKFIKKNQLFCPDKSVLKLWEKYLLSIRKAGSSCGAIIEIRAKGVPVGLGAPIYSKLDMDLASAMMSINAVKGVNIGSGMNSAQLTGEENSDEINQRGKSTKFNSNNAGGILGGISSGQDIIVSFAVKPTSSILSTRKTIDKFGKNTTISVKGRHDPCVGIRAVPIGEAMMHCVILDHYLLNKAQCGN